MLNINLTVDTETVYYGNGLLAFNAPDYIAQLSNKFNLKPFSGVVKIDDREFKFSYSPYFNDGDIVCDSSNKYSITSDKFIVMQVVVAYTHKLIKEKELGL